MEPRRSLHARSIAMLKSMHYLLAFSPYIYLTAFYSFVIRATITLGYIPSYDYPDPKTLHFDIHHEIVWEAFEFSAMGVVLYVALLCFFVARYKTIDKPALSIISVGIGLVLLHLFSDPFFTWFVD